MERYGEIKVADSILNGIAEKNKNFKKDENYIIHFVDIIEAAGGNIHKSFYFDNYSNCYQCRRYHHNNTWVYDSWSEIINPSKHPISKALIDKIKKLDNTNFFSLIPKILDNENKMDNLIYRTIGIEEELKKIRIGYDEIPLIKSKMDKILNENNFTKPDSYSLSMIVKVIEKVSDENQKLKTRLEELEEKIAKYDKIFDKIDKSNEIIETNLSRIIARYET